ncbi:prepilin-type N-terminal cleavage/methylation domain-containing protein [bacterium]|nr:prepilin-type N-terminal cleavage/methylation domain-containing protein [bacterium]
MFPSHFHSAVRRRGFTLIEILVVLGIIAFLAAGLTATIANYLTSAKEAQTVATIRKIDGLITERQQALTRFFDSRDFRKRVDVVHEKLRRGDPANGVAQLFGIAEDFVSVIGRKEMLREALPQRFAEMVDTRNATGALVAGGDSIPDAIQLDEVYGSVKWAVDPSEPPGSRPKPWVDTNGDGTPNAGDTFHDRRTESAELLYFALTRLEQFGLPSVGVGEFRSTEVADTDGDGLPEFIDGWGRPLRFYRWPTRLVKPFGLLGLDQAYGTAGVDDDGNGSADNLTKDIDEIGWPGSDDTYIHPEIRKYASLYVDGLPRQPILIGSPPRPVTGDFDQLNEDGDDPYGILLDETKRLTLTGVNVFSAVNESTYHTFDTYHKPLVVSAGADGVLGLFEPYQNEDVNGSGFLDPGEDTNGNGFLDIGWLAQPINEDINLDGVQQGTEQDLNGNSEFDAFVRPVAALDDITNRNRRAGE